MTTKAMTLRLPPDLYQTGQEIAQQRHISLNALVQEGLQAVIRMEQQRRLYDDFSLLGEDVEGCNVEYAFAAQREVIMGDEAREPHP